VIKVASREGASISTPETLLSIESYPFLRGTFLYLYTKFKISSKPEPCIDRGLTILTVSERLVMPASLPPGRVPRHPRIKNIGPGSGFCPERGQSIHFSPVKTD